MLVTFFRAVIVVMIILKASRGMHNEMLSKVATAKIVFFDSNPIGRILARFSKDVAVLDTVITMMTIFLTFGVFRTLSVLITIVFIHPYVLIVIAFAGLSMYAVYKYVIGVLNDVQRLDSMYRGPLSTSFTNSVSGVVTFRAYERLPFFRQIFID